MDDVSESRKPTQKEGINEQITDSQKSTEIDTVSENSIDSQQESKQTTDKNEKNNEKTNAFAKVFQICTNTDPHHFSSYDNLTKWLHRPVDASSLGVFRLLYGRVENISWPNNS